MECLELHVLHSKLRGGEQKDHLSQKQHLYYYLSFSSLHPRTVLSSQVLQVKQFSIPL